LAGENCLSESGKLLSRYAQRNVFHMDKDKVQSYTQITTYD